MRALKEYETRVIRILTKDVLAPAVLDAVAENGELVSCEHTGAGYFLTLRHSGLPKQRIVCDKPWVVGKSQGVETGFIVFLENNELTLECHAWSQNSVPET